MALSSDERRARRRVAFRPALAVMKLEIMEALEELTTAFDDEDWQTCLTQGGKCQRRIHELAHTIGAIVPVDAIETMVATNLAEQTGLSPEMVQEMRTLDGDKFVEEISEHLAGHFEEEDETNQALRAVEDAEQLIEIDGPELGGEAGGA